MSCGCGVDGERIFRSVPSGSCAAEQEAVELLYRWKREPPGGDPGDAGRAGKLALQAGVRHRRRVLRARWLSDRLVCWPSDRPVVRWDWARPLHLIHGGASSLAGYSARAAARLNAATRRKSHRPGRSRVRQAAAETPAAPRPASRSGRRDQGPARLPGRPLNNTCPARVPPHPGWRRCHPRRYKPLVAASGSEHVEVVHKHQCDDVVRPFEPPRPPGSAHQCAL